MSVIIDRRLNDRNKSATNRARFMRRYKSHIQRAVTDMVAERSIREMEEGGSVDIPRKDISEPRMSHGSGGDREMVLPGNKEFNPGDRIKRPSGGGGGQGNEGGGEGDDSEDDFSFSLSREEFMAIFFDDLELPHMLRTHVGGITEMKPQRAGYSAQGSPVNLSVVRTMRQAMGRRIALSGEARRRLRELEEDTRGDTQGDTQGTNSDEAKVLEMRDLRKRIARVPFLDEVDLRFRNRILVPSPMSQAVMFCLMDVSASMDEQRKDLAKRFYSLLYMFLSRKYERVEIVFIRHTDDAEEVDEECFFNDRKTGGTVVFSALSLMHEIIAERFPPQEWNVYGAQASDGDAFGADPEKSRDFLEAQIVPLVRHFAYIEVNGRSTATPTPLAAAYRRIGSGHFAMTDVRERSDIYPVFRELFSNEQHRVAA